jgi:hypothetical protein
MALSNDFNMAYDQFVSAWLDYERQRNSSDFAARVDGKQKVDELRLRVRAYLTGSTV